MTDFQLFSLYLRTEYTKYTQDLHKIIKTTPPSFQPMKSCLPYRLVFIQNAMFVLGLFSGLKMELNFQRRSIYYLIQIYVPSAMIVVLSWVSNALKVEYPQPDHIFLASDLSWEREEDSSFLSQEEGEVMLTRGWYWYLFFLGWEGKREEF